ncbi:MAG: flagellar type III secretion system pore protein FliP [bacterium]
MVNGLIVPLAQAEPAIPIPKIGLDITEAKNPKDVALTLQILFLLTILSLVPSILIMLTSFVRVVIVFSFIKRALATQEMPPQQVIVGLALFLTFFIMAPTISTIHSNAIKPYLDGKITVGEGISKAEAPLREFMFKQTRERDIDLFLDISKLPRPKNRDEVPTYILMPSFMISELTTAFQMGILLFIPFIVIDMVVASVLMSMGMIMLPPVMISMPFKILLFIIVDGWHLITRSVILSFH